MSEGPDPAQPETAIAPRSLGRYRLRYRVASGGMGSVYLAQLTSEASFEKWVAVKTIHPHIADDPKFVQMFMNEARLMARLDHPNICQVFDFGKAEDTYYLAMEYLHGESLSSVASRGWKKGGISPGLAARIVADAARGLHHAHELRAEDGSPANVVHRDVSPQNVFVLYSGIAKVVDFGIARSEDHAGERTRTGEVKGKIAYMAPEQLTPGAHLDRRVDVWALGVVLWEISVGKRLFRREHDVLTMRAVLDEPIASPASIRPDHPTELGAIIARALARDPAARYQTALELARDLERFIARTGEPCVADDVAERMSAWFADRIEWRGALLQREPTMSIVEVVEIASTSPTAPPIPLERRRPPDPDAGATRVSPPDPPPPAAASPQPLPAEPSPRSPAGSRAWGAAAAVAIALIAGAIGYSASQHGPDAPPMGVLPGPSATAPDERPTVEPQAGTAPATDAPATDTADTPATDTPATDTAATPERDQHADAVESAVPTDAVETDEPARAAAARATAGTTERPRATPRARARVEAPRGGGADPRDALDFGFLQLSTPASGVEVRRGGELLGTTPLRARLPLGTHRLDLVDPGSGRRESIHVQIEPGATTVLRVSIE